VCGEGFWGLLPRFSSLLLCWDACCQIVLACVFAGLFLGLLVPRLLLLFSLFKVYYVLGVVFRPLERRLRARSGAGWRVRAEFGLG